MICVWIIKRLMYNSWGEISWFHRLSGSGSCVDWLNECAACPVYVFLFLSGMSDVCLWDMTNFAHSITRCQKTILRWTDWRRPTLDQIWTWVDKIWQMMGPAAVMVGWVQVPLSPAALVPNCHAFYLQTSLLQGSLRAPNMHALCEAYSVSSPKQSLYSDWWDTSSLRYA